MRAGDRRKTYDAERLDDISSRRQPDRFVFTNDGDDDIGGGGGDGGGAVSNAEIEDDRG